MSANHASAWPPFRFVLAAALAPSIALWCSASRAQSATQSPRPESGGANVPGQAGDLPVAVQADDVELNVKTSALEASGNVRVDVPPFHLVSPHLKLARSRLGVVLTGEGKLLFCPCLGSPLGVAFDGATVAPPDDVIVKQPRLLFFGVPILWAPVFWLRSSARVGVLPPEVTYRGADGLFVGEGVHVPWRAGDTKEGFDLRAGAYLEGGAAVDARLFTEDTTTHVRWDHLRGDGVTLDMRGALGPPEANTAWDVDALRGARGVVATTDLDLASRRYDRAAAETAWRADGFTFAAGVRGASARGGGALDLGAFGPVVSARRGGTLGDLGAYDAGVEGGSLTMPGGGSPLSYARAASGALFATRLGLFDSEVSLRAVADGGSDGARSDADGAAVLRLRTSLPFVRAFDSGDPDDPWVHRIDPRVEIGALAERTTDVFAGSFAPAIPSDAGAAWIATGGLATAVGRFGSRTAAEIDAAAGAVGGVDWTRPLIRARASLTSGWLMASGESAHVLAGEAVPGHAFAVRARFGPALGPNLAANVAARVGVDPIAARALTDAPFEPTSGFLAQDGYTGGARAALPITRYAGIHGGADVDLTNDRLVAAAAGLELRDPCGCMVVRANASHRIGREGVDVWVTVDLPRSP